MAVSANPEEEGQFGSSSGFKSWAAAGFPLVVLENIWEIPYLVGPKWGEPSFLIYVSASF